MTEKDSFQPPFSALKPTATSVAVAIKSGKSQDLPPDIIASGRGKIAEEIIKLAYEKGIKVREDADLAGILATLDLDTPIPNEAIIAVAQILAKVYEANEQAGASPSPDVQNKLMIGMTENFSSHFIEKPT